MVALTNREVQFSGVASSDPVIGWDKGIKTLAISAFTGSLDMQVTAHKDWMSRVGTSRSSPIEARLKALKGARVGASTIGGARLNTHVIWRGRSASIPSGICRLLRSGSALLAWQRFAPNRWM